MENVFYYREGYYLLPDEYADANALIAAAKASPLTLTVRQLIENHDIRSNIQKGICIAPYFYNEYGYPSKFLTIEDPADIFPVEAILLTQKEYNEKLREVILSYCPGCCRYKPISNRVQSLNGHFEEISLDSVCFYRQNSKPSPRVFQSLLWSFGGLANHFDPAPKTTEENLTSLKEILYLPYTGGHKDPDNPCLHVTYKPDFFTEQLTIALSEYIEKHLYLTRFRIAAPVPSGDLKAQVDALLLPANRAAFQKSCKKYGVSIAFLTHSAASSEKILRSLSDLFYHDCARLLYAEPGRLCLLVMNQPELRKGLHFRAPFLRTLNAAIEIYDQYGVSKTSLSFRMEPLDAESPSP